MRLDKRFGLFGVSDAGGFMYASRTFLISALLFISGAAYAAIYEWTDEEGTTHFSDKPIHSGGKKVEIKSTPMYEKTEKEKKPETKKEKKSEAKKEQNTKKSTDSGEKELSAKEKASKSREKLTDELIKAREIREAKRKKQKEERRKRLILCQDEKTKLALMENELLFLDKKLKTMTRTEREKSVEFIKKSDMTIRIKRQKSRSYEECN